MSSTAINTNSSSSYSLPTPKVRLSRIGLFKPIEWYETSSNSVGGTFELYNYPEVVANDLPEELIEKGVYVEMLVYRNGRSNSLGNKKNADSAYKVPVGMLNGDNITFPGYATRGGNQFNVSTGSSMAPNSPNWYKVNAANEVINVADYLNNKFSFTNIYYRDLTAGLVVTNILIPTSRRNESYLFGRTFMYSPKYSPMYVAFRLIMPNDDGRTFTVGATSKVVKICYDVHPFLVDANASQINGKASGTVNPLLEFKKMRCMFETRLP